MEKISKPGIDINTIISAHEDNIRHLKEWVEVLKAPFENPAFCRECFLIGNILDANTSKLLPDPSKDLVILFFPTRALALYKNDERKYGGKIVFSLDNKACLSFSKIINDHYIGNCADIIRAKGRTINGTFHEISETYLKYLTGLMDVPATNK